MGDIDRTYERLRRVDYSTLLSLIHNNKASPIINPHTFRLEYTRFAEPVCIANGWTLEELNNKLNNYDK